ncbi:hypothetical protein R3P38DRAFT_3207514 [Favolaschia claudopus]|uniref:Uncharacterized protein n=1 Tax=Favolaschia claudopus TaxID=2862362 RepID=A0AAW0AJS1_9AGAR
MHILSVFQHAEAAAHFRLSPTALPVRAIAAHEVTPPYPMLFVVHHPDLVFSAFPGTRTQSRTLLVAYSPTTSVTPFNILPSPTLALPLCESSQGSDTQFAIPSLGKVRCMPSPSASLIAAFWTPAHHLVVHRIRSPSRIPLRFVAMNQGGASFFVDLRVHACTLRRIETAVECRIAHGDLCQRFCRVFGPAPGRRMFEGELSMESRHLVRSISHGAPSSFFKPTGLTRDSAAAPAAPHPGQLGALPARLRYGCSSSRALGCSFRRRFPASAGGAPHSQPNDSLLAEGRPSRLAVWVLETLVMPIIRVRRRGCGYQHTRRGGFRLASSALPTNLLDALSTMSLTVGGVCAPTEHAAHTASSTFWILSCTRWRGRRCQLVCA